MDGQERLVSRAGHILPLPRWGSLLSLRSLRYCHIQLTEVSVCLLSLLWTQECVEFVRILSEMSRINHVLSGGLLREIRVLFAYLVPIFLD